LELNPEVVTLTPGTSTIKLTLPARKKFQPLVLPLQAGFTALEL